MLQDKSILSQYQTPLTYKSCKQSQTLIVPPLHSGICSYHLHKHLSNRGKANQSQASFGTSSNRVAIQIEPKVQNHNVSYIPIYQRQNYQNSLHKKASVFSISQRFNTNISHNPSPNKYYPQYSIKQTKPSPGKIGFPKLQRQALPIKDKQNTIGPGSYNIDQQITCFNSNLRVKIKQKLEFNRKKYEYIMKKNQKKQLDLKFNEDKKHNQIDEIPQNDKKMKQKDQIDRFSLKKNTEKYISKYNNYQFQQSHGNYNSYYPRFSPAFIEKNENPYMSYLIKNQQIPGPGSYMREAKTKIQPKQTYVFKSQCSRQVFGNGTIKVKQKVKLSQIL